MPRPRKAKGALSTAGRERVPDPQIDPEPRYGTMASLKPGAGTFTRLRLGFAFAQGLEFFRASETPRAYWHVSGLGTFLLNYFRLGSQESRTHLASSAALWDFDRKTEPQGFHDSMRMPRAGLSKKGSLIVLICFLLQSPVNLFVLPGSSRFASGQRTHILKSSVQSSSEVLG